MIDPEAVNFSSVAVPFYPQAGEAVEFRASQTGRHTVVVVNSIDSRHQVANGTVLKKVGGPHP